MTPQEFIKSEGFTRATRIAKSAPHWAIYYDAEKHCYDNIRCDSSVCLLELEDVLQGCGQ